MYAAEEERIKALRASRYKFKIPKK